MPLVGLIVEDDDTTRAVVEEIVTREGFEVSSTSTLEGARRHLRDKDYDLLILDVRLPDGSGLDLIEEIEDRRRTEVVFITAFAREKDSVRAKQLGASHYLTKPIDSDIIRDLAQDVGRTQRLRKDVRSLRRELRTLGHFGPLRGASKSMQTLYDEIERVAPSDASVLIIGESGTGKELVARTVHQFSARSEKPLISLNCAAIAPNLIESELFGHERGSFTGATESREGVFERAHEGTLFLDEITEMPAELQTKLLRVLETGTILRVGAEKEIQANVRVLAATNRDATEAVRDGKLREDLLYRLCVFPIHVPALRERPSDVSLLAAHFLSELNRAQGTSKRLSDACIEWLSKYEWPGNVRELKNVIHRAFILAEEVIEPEPSYFQHPCLPSGDSAPRMNGSSTRHSGDVLEIEVGSALDEVEKRLILATLEKVEDNKKRAAEILGISVRTLYNRLKEYES